MDALAKAYLGHSYHFEPLDDLLTDDEWTIRINSRKVCRKLKLTIDCFLRAQQIILHWTTPKHTNGILKQPRFSMTQISAIDFNSIQQSWSHQRGCLRRFICKMATDQLATGRYMKRMRFWPSDKCPRCLEPNETTLHVLTCTDPGAVQLLQQRCNEMETLLSNFPTKPELIQGILSLYASFSNASIKVKPFTCVTAQLQLPIHEFVRGRIVKNWRQEQEKFLQRIRSRRSSTRWTHTLIHEIWKTFFSMWLHCNEAYHSDSIKQNKIQQLTKLNQEIRRQWAIGKQGLPPADKHHFQHTKLAQLLKKQLHYKQQWLQSVVLARQSRHQLEQPQRPKKVRKRGKS